MYQGSAIDTCNVCEEDSISFVSTITSEGVLTLRNNYVIKLNVCDLAQRKSDSPHGRRSSVKVRQSLPVPIAQLEERFRDMEEVVDSNSTGNTIIGSIV